MVEVIGTGLGKRYANGTWGLRDLDIRVRDGTFLAVIGHNGAGKSTLLNMLGRVLRPTRGTLEIRPREIRPSWSPQRVLVDWSLTVRQNVELAALLAGHRTPATVRPAVDEVLELLDLAKVAGEEAENLSGGQLQRVQIARALAVESGLYVMDEPAAGLDPAAADLVMNHLRDKASRGAAVVVSSHDLDAVERTADHLLLLDSGAAVADLPVAEFVASTGGRMAVTVKVEGSAPDFVAGTPESWTVTRSDDRSSLVFDVPISVPVGEVLAAVPAGLAVADLDVRRQSLRDVYLARSAGGE